MRLLERGPGGEFVLTKPFLNRDIPEYAILSHTWGPDSEEVSFHDLTNGTGQAKTGYEKIRFCANQADRDDLRYFWIDTCCIDKTNSTELGEAINSMFRWYQNAARCYVFLSDVSLPDVQGSQAPPFQLCESAFRASRWFTRGWTLQELLAPRSVEFFASDGTRLGDKTTLQRQIHEVTGISISALCGESIEGFNIEERFKWAESRQTTKDEDWAYSLLGIFGVFIPLIYGEGRESAVRRLRKEIRGKGNEADPDDGNPKAASAVCLVPYTSNPDFIGRSDILGKLTDALGFGPTRTNPTAQPRLALFGLGGVGKTQIAISFLYQLRQTQSQVSVFWVHASTMERFRQAYSHIATECSVPGQDDPNADVLPLGDLLQEKLEAHTQDPNPDDLMALASRLEHLPLALVQAAAFIQATSIQAEDYLELLNNSDQNLVDLLSEEFETVGRDVESKHPVTETWMLSFEQIQRQDNFAGELLSMMSLLDRQAIPREFLSCYSNQRQQSRGKIQLIKALGSLKAFSFVTEGKDGGLDMHRLVQLVTRKWLDKNGTASHFADQALSVVLQNYPFGKHETWKTCSAYLPHARSVLELRGTGSRDEQLSRAQLLHNVGGYFYTLCYWKDAERVIAEAVPIWKEQLGEDDPSTLQTMDSLAAAYWRQGQLSIAKELCARVMEKRKEILGDEHPDTLHTMSLLASISTDQGELKEAEELHTRVMNLSKKALGETHPYTLTSINNLASTYRKQGRWKEAEALHTRVMNLSKKALGETHPCTLTIMNNLGTIYYHQERWDEAKSLLEQVVQLQERQCWGWNTQIRWGAWVA